MSGLLSRAFKIIEHLVDHPGGCPMSAIASDLDIPVSATHRVLTELVAQGYVHQVAGTGQYVLSFRLVSLGLSFLANTGVTDVVQPMLDRLAQETGELVRLAVVDGDELTFVAKAQGARLGLRYDPDMGLSVNLACSAAGHAWLSALSDEEALARISKQGFGRAEDFGKNAPRTFKEVLAYLEATRKRGFALIMEVFAPGMGSIAAPVFGAGNAVIGVITVAGPLIRFDKARMLACGSTLLKTAADVSHAQSASAFFKRA